MLYPFLLIPLQAGGSSMIMNIILFASIPLIFYFFMIRPQAAKAKKELSFIAGLQKGDKVVTKSGIHGKIYAIDEKTVTLEVDTNCRIKMEKVAISEDMTLEGRSEKPAKTS